MQRTRKRDRYMYRRYIYMYLGSRWFGQPDNDGDDVNDDDDDDNNDYDNHNCYQIEDNNTCVLCKHVVWTCCVDSGFEFEFDV